MVLRLPFAVAALALTGALAGCPTAVPIAGSAPSSAPAARGVLTGTLRVPASIISYNGGGFISTNGGGIVATGGGNIVAQGGGNFGLLELEAQGVGGAKVFLADAAGNPIPNLPTTQTDATGKFTLSDVPPNYTFMVAAQAPTAAGKTATFQTLARTSELGTTADIDANTSLVTSAVVRDLENGDLGGFNPATFSTATQATAQNLTDAGLPDFTDRADVQAKMDALVATVGELKQSVDALRQDIADLKQSFADLQKAIEQRLPAAPSSAPGMPATAAPVAASAAPGACGAPQAHSFHPSFDGRMIGAGWHLSASSAVNFVDATSDANGVITLRVPAGCPLTLTLADPAGPKLTAAFQVDAAKQDTTLEPIRLNFGKDTAPPDAPAACTKDAVTWMVHAASGLAVKSIRIASTSGIVYTADVGADGTAYSLAPIGCPLEITGSDAKGQALGPIHLTIDDARNPQPVVFP